MKRPTHCPYCSEQVDRMLPYKHETPPDERDDYPPMVGLSEERETPESIPIDIIDCQRMIPCGHLFRDDDLEATLDGHEPVVTLGDRVVNPTSVDE